ncbi:MAG: hypothetical protein WC069_05795 [Candidatus Shapirobacteria bacterium]
MFKEIQFEKEFQLWTSNSDGGWSYEEYDTIEECITATKYATKWKISQRVEFKIQLTEKL